MRLLNIWLVCVSVLSLVQCDKTCDERPDIFQAMFSYWYQHILLPKQFFLNKDKQYYCPLGNANTESSSQFPHIFSSHSPGVKSMFILLVCLCHMRLFAYILSVNDSYLKQHPQGCFFTDWLTVYCCGLRLPLSGCFNLFKLPRAPEEPPAPGSHLRS